MCKCIHLCIRHRPVSMSYSGTKKRKIEAIDPSSDADAVDRDGMESLAVMKESINPTVARPLDDTFLSSKFEIVRTSTSNYESARELMFHFNGNSTEQMDLSNTTFTVELQILKKNGELFQDDMSKALTDNAYLRQNIFHNLWSDVEVYINNQLVKLPMNDYARSSYIWKSMTIKKEHLEYETHTTDFRMMETHLDPTHLPPTTESGINADSEDPYQDAYQHYVSGSDKFQLTGTIDHPFLRQKTMIPPGIPFTVRMVRNDSSLLFQTASTSSAPVVRIKDAFFRLKRLQLTPAAQEAQNQAVVKSKVLRFPLKTLQMIKLNMQPQNTVFNFYQALTGEVPSRAIMVFVRDESAEKGNTTKHPFFFENLKMKGMKFVYNNTVYPSPDGYKFHYSTDPKELELMNKDMFHQVMSVFHENPGEAALDYDKWLKHSFMLTFDFTAQCDAKKIDGFLQPTSVGDMRWGIELNEPLPHAMMALFLAERDSTLLVSIPTLSIQVED